MVLTRFSGAFLVLNSLFLITYSPQVIGDPEEVGAGLFHDNSNNVNSHMMQVSLKQSRFIRLCLETNPILAIKIYEALYYCCLVSILCLESNPILDWYS